MTTKPTPAAAVNAVRARPRSRAARARERQPRLLVAHQKNVTIGAAAAGFVLTGGIAAFGGLFRRKGR